MFQLKTGFRCQDTSKVVGKHILTKRKW